MRQRIPRGLAGVAFAVTAVSAVLSFGALSRASQTLPPSRFVGVVQGAGVKQTLGLYSSMTGQLVRRLATFGLRFTNNGLAVSPDDATVFFTLIPHGDHSLRLMRLDVATGHQRFVAAGEQPAVNDLGTELAFTTGAEDVAVRDLNSGTTRRLNLSHVLGYRIDPLNTDLAWLADGTSVAAIPAEPATPGSVSRQTPTENGRCRPRKDRQPILFIRVPPPPARLSVRCRVVAAGASSPLVDGGGGATILASSPTNPAAVWIAGFNSRSSSIDQITQTGQATRVLDLGRATLPVAIDRLSQQILYIKGHRPPALWEATITQGHLTGAHQLVASSQFETAAW